MQEVINLGSLADKNFLQHPNDILNSFLGVFTALDKPRFAALEINPQKVKTSLAALIKSTLEKIDDSNLPISYKIYLPLYKAVQTSQFLGNHRYPKFDKWRHQTYTATQTTLMKLIRDAAFNVLQRQAWIGDLLNENIAIKTALLEAKYLPLFAEHRSNYPNFFQRRRVTATVNKLDELIKNVDNFRGFGASPVARVR